MSWEPEIADAARLGSIQAAMLAQAEVEPVDVSAAPEGLHVQRVPGRITLRRQPGLVVSLGGDPGGTTGLFLGGWRDGQKRPPVLARAWSCDAGAAPELLEWILGDYGAMITVAGFEAYDARKNARGMTAKAMYELTSALVAAVAGAGIPVVTRPPSMVKPWATDRRLSAAGVLDLTGKMPDARDASRHSLYAASKDGGLRDPLSRVRA